MRFFLFCLALPIFLFSCSSTDSGGGGGQPPATAAPAPFTLTGQITYDYIPPQATPSVRLLYTSKTQRPVRRALIQALDSNGVDRAGAYTDDNGNYTLSVPAYVVSLRVWARSAAVAYTPDGIGSDNCNGANWDVRVVDNVTNNPATALNGALRGNYVLDSGMTYSTTTTVNLNAATNFSSGYSSRTGAPFALLDTMISEIETVCQGQANVTLPLMYMNWNAINVGVSGSKYAGNITTSHFTTEGGVGNIYILGKENVDTDEYDKHVVAHEFGHFVESRLFRSDSIGGNHSAGDSLDPRVAFGEGYGYAIAGMTFNDPVNVDTSGSNQVGGFYFDISTAPTGDDRGYYSERSSFHFLWKLYDNRDGTANSGSFDRIFNIMNNYQRTTAALTSIQSFASYYNQVYGSAAESLQTLWATTLDTPYNSLCSGACTGSGDTADPFDVDGDIGTYYNAQSRRYVQSSGSTRTAAFWRMYRTLVSGTNSSDGHELTVTSGYTYPTNKLGSVRWFRYVAGSTTNVTMTVSGGTANCSQDYLDMYVYSAGTLLSYDIGTGGCPSVTFAATSGVVYTMAIRAYTSGTSSYDITVSP